MTEQEFVDKVAERIFVRERYAETLGPWSELYESQAVSFLERARRAIEDVTGARRPPAPRCRCGSRCSTPPSFVERARRASKDVPVEPVVVELREQNKLIATQNEILSKQLDVARAGIQELVGALRGRS